MERQSRQRRVKIVALVFTAAAVAAVADGCSSSTASGGTSVRGGDKCTTAAECPSHVCSNGVCQPGDSSTAGNLPGSSCSQDGECASNKCTNGVCESGGTLPNTTCSVGADCASGICLGGKCEIPGTSTGGMGGPGGAMAGNPMTMCMAGSLGCPCMGMGNKCKAGLACTGGKCCDAKTNACTPPAGTGAPGGGTGTTGGSTGGPTSGNAACTPGFVGPIVTNCGYPYSSGNPLTNIVFNESEVLAAILPSGGYPFASIQLFYNDEHAMTLGVRQTVINGVAKDYDVSPLTSNPQVIENPKTGTNDITGQQAGVDPSGRPMWPALFITDITSDQNATSGDWQWGGGAVNPSYVAGTWKAAVRTVDASGASITPDADPVKNGTNYGNGDTAPAGALGMDQQYGAEVRWDLRLEAGHNYRFQVMVHDGDQNKVGGDTGEACITFCAGTACPTGVATCNTDADCSNGYACIGGCCVPPPPPPPPPPDSGTCPPNWQQYLQSEGRKICTPPPTNGECPPGYVLTIQNNVQYCAPVVIR